MDALSCTVVSASTIFGIIYTIFPFFPSYEETVPQENHEFCPPKPHLHRAHTKYSVHCIPGDLDSGKRTKAENTAALEGLALYELFMYKTPAKIPIMMIDQQKLSQKIWNFLEKFLPFFQGYAIIPPQVNRCKKNQRRKDK